MNGSKRTALTAVLVLLTAAASCAPLRGGSGPDSPPPAALLRVVNHNWSAVELHLVSPSRSHRLGTLETSQTGVYRIPRDFLDSSATRIAARPFATRTRFESDPMPMAWGSDIVFTVQSQIELSAFSIRDPVDAETRGGFPRR